MDWKHMIKGLEQLCDSIRAGESTKALHQAEELEELARIEDEGVDFKAVVDNLLDGVYVTDGKAVTQYVNPAYTKHTGIQPEEIVGRLDRLLEGEFRRAAEKFSAGEPVS